MGLRQARDDSSGRVNGASLTLTYVGITHDTAEFAVAAIRTWLEKMGRPRYPAARELTITADCGGKPMQNSDSAS